MLVTINYWSLSNECIVVDIKYYCLLTYMLSGDEYNQFTNSELHRVSIPISKDVGLHNETVSSFAFVVVNFRVYRSLVSVSIKNYSFKKNKTWFQFRADVQFVQNFKLC